jgi:GNAT superfamily N-acetyltransferase
MGKEKEKEHDCIYMRCYDMGGYTADSSDLVTPLIGIGSTIVLEGVEQWSIKPFQKHDESVAASVVAELKEEWSSLTEDTIRREWPGSSDAFYVLVDSENSVIGTVAVDRKHFHPFISNLFVVPSRRSKGWSRVLLNHAQHFIQSVLQFNEARLWCVPALCPYYERMGWSRDLKDIKERNEKKDKDKDVVVMIKNF